MKDYTAERGFWERLEDFVENVQVADPASHEEKEMILSVCKEKIEEVEG